MSGTCAAFGSEEVVPAVLFDDVRSFRHFLRDGGCAQESRLCETLAACEVDLDCVCAELGASSLSSAGPTETGGGEVDFIVVVKEQL